MLGDALFLPMRGHPHDELKGNGRSTRPLLIALAITLTFAVVELFGGFLSGSLALISDSGHMFTDVLALALSLWAGVVAMRMANEKQTFGYLRAEILVALINGVGLGVVSIIIMYEAVVRIQNPVDIESQLMLLVAVAGLAANVAAALLLRPGARENLNVKGAFLHVLGDLLSSVGVIVSALFIYFFGLRIADPAISLVIGVVILYGSARIVMQSAYILLEFTPGNLDLAELRKEMRMVPGVVDVHDIHAWTLGSGVYAMSAHLQVNDQPVSACSCIVKDCERLLKEKFRISHTTLQLEYEACQDEVCVFRRPGGANEEEHEH